MVLASCFHMFMFSHVLTKDIANHKAHINTFIVDYFYCEHYLCHNIWIVRVMSIKVFILGKGITFFVCAQLLNICRTAHTGLDTSITSTSLIQLITSWTCFKSIIMLMAATWIWQSPHICKKTLFFVPQIVLCWTL